MLNHKKAFSVAMGAAFLMAMSAVGPGFLTQTAAFTSQMGADFGFAILVCILVDIGVQLNIWRIICVSGNGHNRLPMNWYRVSVTCSRH
ncbi:Mn2+/Fe2+ transporter, NRAMP family [Sporolactobacillus inulinus]|uniref:Mn2+/Fe2+ transporter, NRAMP family n=1 Tax=Sporolactobacillus inulinus TaxID=2078 RepID=A0A4Y1Z7I9_9BACL|nr:Mn2+/Fe2+ transporter, NRAMP family [Sporolactobacillus inulinus]